MSFFKKMVVNKPNCVKCGLHSRCISPKMDVSGEGKQGILIISTAPTEEEDREHGILQVVLEILYVELYCKTT